MKLNQYEVGILVQSVGSKSALWKAAFMEYNSDAMVEGRPVLNWNDEDNFKIVLMWQCNKVGRV